MPVAVRRRTRARAFLALLFAILGGLAASVGCAARTGRIPTAPLNEPAAFQLLDETARLAASVRRYQAVVRLRGEGRRGRFSGRMLVVFVRPSGGPNPEAVEALRLELFGPVGGSRWTLVAGPEAVRLVVPAERAFAEGEELEEFTGPLFGVSVGRTQIAALLVGSGAPIGGAGNLRSLPASGSAVLANGTEIWWDGALAGAQVRRVVTTGYEARYPGDYRRRRRQVPRRVEVASEDMRATLTVEELEVNAALHPDSFRVRTPPGYRRAGVRELSRASGLPEG